MEKMTDFGYECSIDEHGNIKITTGYLTGITSGYVDGKILTFTPNDIAQLAREVGVSQPAEAEPVARTVETVQGVPAEVEYTNQNGEVIGYWAYGEFDPNLPYQGYPPNIPERPCLTDSDIAAIASELWHGDGFSSESDFIQGLIDAFQDHFAAAQPQEGGDT